MQLNTYFIIFQEKHQRNLAQILFSELGRFRPGPFSRIALPPGLQARKLGPGPGKWRSHAGLLGPWGDRLPRAVGCDPTARSAPGRNKNRGLAAPLKTLAHFSPSPLSSLGGGDGRAGRRRGRARAPRAEGAGGAAEPHSPDPRAALAGARLRRAVLDSALKRPPARA